MRDDYMLHGATAKTLYSEYGDLPVVDYHCHLSPEEMYRDEPFDNIGQMWLAHDHYKWRLMRSSGIDEKYITGDAPWHDKFLKYAEIIELSGGSPLYHWTQMELMRYFGICEPLGTLTAERIWNTANSVIRDTKMSPRKLIAQSNVETICTCDEITSDLKFHAFIAADGTFPARVIPSFRTDSLLLMRREGYGGFLRALEDVSGVAIECLDDLKKAVGERLGFFSLNGCRFSDVGITYFPDRFYGDKKASDVFDGILNGGDVSDGDYLGLLGNMYVFLGRLYKKHDMTAQMHIAVLRNVNSEVFGFFGSDGGVDCTGDIIGGEAVARLLDRLNGEGALPRTILFSLNPANMEQLGSVVTAFRNVRLGPSWWFWDHRRGIERQLDIIAESGCIGLFPGMLTDSRSFLSYSRHDYFRRIFCEKVGRWVDDGELDLSAARKIVRNVFYLNAAGLVKSDGFENL